MTSASTAGGLEVRRPSMAHQVIRADPTHGARVVHGCGPRVHPDHVQAAVVSHPTPQLGRVQAVLGGPD